MGCLVNQESRTIGRARGENGRGCLTVDKRPARYARKQRVVRETAEGKRGTAVRSAELFAAKTVNLPITINDLRERALPFCLFAVELRARRATARKRRMNIC